MMETVEQISSVSPTIVNTVALGALVNAYLLKFAAVMMQLATISV
jgi:hypothetical protein